jgi:hypothetical protein
MTPWIEEQIAALRRHDAEESAAAHRRAALLPPSPSWRDCTGSAIVRLGTWIAGHPVPPR